MLNALHILIIAVAVSAVGNATAEEFALVGAGTQSCGKLIATVSDSDQQTEEVMEFVYMAWTQGFLSSINWNSRVESTYVNLEDDDGQWLWLKNWCNENPLKPVFLGVHNLYQHLAAAQGVPLISLPPVLPTQPREE